MDAPLVGSAACLGDQVTHTASMTQDAVVVTEEGSRKMTESPASLSEQHQMNVDEMATPSDINNQNFTPSAAMKFDGAVDVNQMPAVPRRRKETGEEDYPEFELEMDDMDEDEDGSFDYNESNNTNASVHEKLEPAGPPEVISDAANNRNDNNQEEATSERPQRKAALQARQKLASVVASLEPYRGSRGRSRDNSNSNNSRRKRGANSRTNRRKSNRNSSNSNRKRKRNQSNQSMVRRSKRRAI